MTDVSVVLLPEVCKLVSKTPDRPKWPNKHTKKNMVRNTHFQCVLERNHMLNCLVQTCWVMRGGVGWDLAGSIRLALEKLRLQVRGTITGTNQRKTQQNGHGLSVFQPIYTLNYLYGKRCFNSPSCLVKCQVLMFKHFLWYISLLNLGCCQIKIKNTHKTPIKQKAFQQ